MKVKTIREQDGKIVFGRLRGLMDKASPSGGEDWRFESARGRFFFVVCCLL